VTIDTRISTAFEAENGFPLEPHLVVLALMGSHSHGTYMPPEDPDAVDDVDLMGFDQELLVRFRKLHREHFSGYMGEKRKAMVRKYQYDVKNAAHLIRLLRMGIEFLGTGVLQVYRTSDAEELKSIKRGQWTLDQVKAEAERLFAQVEPARAQSPLPAAPDSAAANRLLIDIHRRMVGRTLG
jgi:hypothetical protein